MAFWIDSSPPSEILKKKKDAQWRDDGSSKVIQPGTELSRGISDWLREQSDGSPGTTIGNFLIIPQDYDKYAATYQQMDALARIWRIPSPVFGIVCGNPAQALCPSATVTCADGTPWICLALKPEPADDLGCRFGPHMPFSHYVMITFPLIKEVTQSTNMDRQSNCLVFCPRRYFEKIESAVSSPNLLQVSEARMHVWQFLILIIAQIDEGWRVFYARILMDSEYVRRSIMQSQASMISAESLVILDQLISRIAEIIVDIRHITAAIHCIKEILSNVADRRSQEGIEFRRLLDAVRFYQTRFGSSARSWVDLSKKLTMLRINTFNLVQLNNSMFVRTNTISIRRLDERNFLEAEKLRVLTRKSAQDARDMKRLATLTMIFLPSTVVAAFFSTPFMTLDEGLNFKALSKVWIFFLTSGIVTLLTFGVSWTWDAMVRWRLSNNIEENESPQSEIHDPDKVVLEPEPGQFTSSDLIEDIFRGWEGSEAGIGDKDDGSSTVNTRAEEASSLEA